MALPNISITNIDALREFWMDIRSDLEKVEAEKALERIRIPVKNFTAYGGARQLLESINHVIVIAGPSETGKTLAALHKIDGLCWAYPGCQALVARKTYADAVGSICQTWEQKVVKLDTVSGKSMDGVESYGGTRPWLYKYPNGSQVWIAGMDSPGKVLSSERDVILLNQAEEFNLEDFEVLSTRCTGRAGNIPNPQIILDANPGAPTHWLRTAPIMRVIGDGGDVEWINSKHNDNPRLFNQETGEITPAGKQTLRELSKLTGARRGRLYLGLWVAAEGMVYEDCFDRERNVVRRRALPATWPRYWVIDFGYTNPFCWQCWVQDPDSRLIMQYEIYYTRRTVREHTRNILKHMLNEPRPRAIITDHDIEDRMTFEQHNVYCHKCDIAITGDDLPAHRSHSLTYFDLTTQAAVKMVSMGIQAVSERLVDAGDGRARLEFMEGALLEFDQSLRDHHLPTCTIEEIEGYNWPKNSRGAVIKEIPEKGNDHGMDNTRYIVAHVDNIAQRNTNNAGAVGPSKPVYGAVSNGSKHYANEREIIAKRNGKRNYIMSQS